MERATIDRDTFVRPNARLSAGVRATLIAGTVTLGDGSAYAATVSVGRRVTFYGRNGFRLVEAYLLDFSGDLYGQWVEVRLCSRLRPQRRFPDVDALSSAAQ
jgi:FAD synthase